MEAVGDVKEQVQRNKILVDPLKSFIYRAGRVISCVDGCHGGDISAFVSANSGIALSKFKTCHFGIEHKACFDASTI